MKEAKFIRKGRVITNVETGDSKHYEFINEAKRESHNIQLSEDGALGRGSLVVQ